MKPEESKKLAVLAYHRIGHPETGKWDTWNRIPTNIFHQQLSFLKESQWDVIDAKTYISGISAPERLPPKSLLITFDDACHSVYENALPVLKEFKFPAVVFVPTNYIGMTNLWDKGIEPEGNICGWEELQLLTSANVSIQSHGLSHRTFSQLNLTDTKMEVIKSKKLLEDKLGKKVELFSFPYGDLGNDPEQTTKLLSEANYQSAFLYGGNHKPISLPIKERYQINRIAVFRDTDLQSKLNP